MFSFLRGWNRRSSSTDIVLVDNDQDSDMLPSLESSDTYETSKAHLRDELRWIDLFIRAQTRRWQVLIARHKPEHLWGMVTITEQEVVDYLHSPFIAPDDLLDALEYKLEFDWQQASRLRDDIARRVDNTSDETLLRLKHVESLFGLSDYEKCVLLIALLPELDSRYRRLLAYLQDDATCRHPSIELIQQILHPVGDGFAAFAASALLTHHLINLSSDNLRAMRFVQVDERIVSYVQEQDTPDKRLQPVVTLMNPVLYWDDLIIQPNLLSQLQSLTQWRSQNTQLGLTLYFQGAYGSGRLAAAQAMCAELDMTLLVVHMDDALRSPETWELFVDLAYREALLQGAALYWSDCERLLEPEHPAHHWQYLTAAAERLDVMTIFASETAWEPTGRFHDSRFVRLDFPMPNYGLRRQIWETALPSLSEFRPPPPERSLLAETLANSFQFTQGQVHDALVTARGIAALRDPDRPLLTASDLSEACRRQSGARLLSLARRIEPRTELTFDDLILPPANMRQLEELRGRIRFLSRVYSDFGLERRLSLGKGLIALFTGQSGTGKTMSAELLAREQGVDLYKVDLSAIVSKYVGETEKNLSQMFMQAEDANAIIFFDEADALFGKRGEVKEAQDRWANIEVNYLLQRLEEYTGVVILASNLRQNIDDAFLRRIHVIVEFPFPDAQARSHIWQGMFTPQIATPPPEAIDTLAAKFQLAGGNIKNIVIDATFRALESATCPEPEITLRHLVIATAREYQKLGKPLTRGEFGDEWYQWIQEDIL